MFPSPEQGGRDGEAQLVDERGAQLLPNRGHATTQSDVTVARRILRLPQRSVNTVGDEAKLGAARQIERCARVMREYENGRVIGGLVTPPSFPAVVRPRTSHGAEHITAENPGADPG